MIATHFDRALDLGRRLGQRTTCGPWLVGLCLACLTLALPRPSAAQAPGPTTPSPDSFRDSELQQKLDDATPRAASPQAPSSLASELSTCAQIPEDDSRRPLLRRLATLGVGGVDIKDCRDLEPFGIPDGLEARIVGSDHALVAYVLNTLAREGYWIELSPLADDQLHMVARSTTGLAGGFRYVRVDEIKIGGQFLPGDDVQRIRRIVAFDGNSLLPTTIVERLVDLGYGVTFDPQARGRLRLQIRPRRRIRRVDVHRHLPLAERELLAQLSLDAQPGALARGTCISRKRARKAATATSPCGTGDFACRQWERYETQRLEKHLVDHGYLLGRAKLALECGRRGDEATLHVHIDHGQAYQIAKDEVRVRVEDRTLPAALTRQIARDFIPRRTIFFDGPITRQFIQTEREKLEANFAEPSRGLGRIYFRELPPFPQVAVTTSLDELGPPLEPERGEIPLDITIDLGRPVLTGYAAVSAAEHERAPARRSKRKRGLDFTHAQLDEQLQLFKRRDPASATVALREAGHLRAFLQEEGYLLAEVQGTFVEHEAHDQMNFAIDQGPKVRIRALEISHPDQIDARLAKRVEEAFAERRTLRKGRSFSDAHALEDMTSLLEAYGKAGYLCARAKIEIALWEGGLDEAGAHAELTAERIVQSVGKPTWIDDFGRRELAALRKLARGRVFVRFSIDAGPKLQTGERETIRHLAEPIPTSRRIDRGARRTRAQWGARRALYETALRRTGSDQPGGVPISLELDRIVPREISRRYADDGFPIADAELSWKWERPDGSARDYVDARDLVRDPEGVCRLRHVGVIELTPVLHVYEGRRGRFGDTLIRGNFKTSTAVLARQIRFERGDAYSQRLVARSRARLENLGVAQRVVFIPHATGCKPDDRGDCLVHHVVKIEEADDVFMALSFGMGTATLNPLYFFVRPRMPNVLGTAWNIEGEASYGVAFEDQQTDFHGCLGASCYEHRARIGLIRPQIAGSIVDLDLGVQYQQRVTPARGELDSFSSSIRASWPVRGGLKLYAGYRFQHANISKPVIKPLGGASGNLWISRRTDTISNNTGLLEFGAAWSSFDNPFNPNSGYQLNIDAMLAAPWLGGDDTWAGVDLSWQHFVPIPRTKDRLNFRYSLRFGQLFPFRSLGTDIVPEVWRYYGGGSLDLGLRGILHESMLTEIEEIPLQFGGTLHRPRARGGHIRGIGSIALHVVSIPDIIGGKLAHSIFYDFGILTHFWRGFDLRREWRHSIGINALKLDIGVATIAIGYAILLPPNIRATDDRNGRAVFDIGVTF